jgi:hypothetical protein
VQAMRPPIASPACSYEVDDELTIVAVDDQWSEFARENDGLDLVPPGPLGRPLLSYIFDLPTAYLYRRLFQRVRETGVPLVVPFRCDSPKLRRFLELRLEPRAGSGFRLSTVLLRAEDRPPVPLLDRSRHHSDEHLLMCGWCKRVALPVEWVEVEVAVAALRLFERELLPEVTHGVCPTCLEAVERTLR